MNRDLAIHDLAIRRLQLILNAFYYGPILVHK